MARLGVKLADSNNDGIYIHNGVKSSVVVDIKEKQDMDPSLVGLKKFLTIKNIYVLSQGRDGMIRYQDWLCVSNVDGLREVILKEAHNSPYSIYLGSTKRY